MKEHLELDGRLFCGYGIWTIPNLTTWVANSKPHSQLYNTCTTTSTLSRSTKKTINLAFILNFLCGPAGGRADGIDR